MDPAGQAAWIQAIGTIFAVIVAVMIPYCQRWNDQKTKKSNDRKIVMSAATNLSVALDYASMKMDFSPAGDGVITHDFTLEQAREFMKLEPMTREALKDALDKSHFFDEKLCEKIVLLSIDAATYERIIDEVAFHTPGGNVDTFLKNMQERKRTLSLRLDEVRNLLKVYLPQTY